MNKTACAVTVEPNSPDRRCPVDKIETGRLVFNCLCEERDCDFFSNHEPSYTCDYEMKIYGSLFTQCTNQKAKDSAIEFARLVLNETK
jgi:hypothetical protein